MLGLRVRVERIGFGIAFFNKKIYIIEFIQINLWNSLCEFPVDIYMCKLANELFVKAYIMYTGHLTFLEKVLLL